MIYVIYWEKDYEYFRQLTKETRLILGKMIRLNCHKIFGVMFTILFQFGFKTVSTLFV